MSKLQTIQFESLSDTVTLLLSDSKKTFLREEVKNISFLPSPWFALHRVNKTQRTNYIRNLLLLTVVCGVLSFVVGGTHLPSLVIGFYSFILFIGLFLLMLAPKKSNKLEISTSHETIYLDQLSPAQISKIYQVLKSKVSNQFPQEGLILQTKVVRNKLATGISLIISVIVLFLVSKTPIGTIHLILLFFYCLLLTGSLAFNNKYQPVIDVFLVETGLKFFELEGKYAKEEHLMDANMIERVASDSSNVIGLVRKSRKIISSHPENKETGLFHFNRKDLHFFHQAYLPFKKYNGVAPFFSDWLNDELMKRKNMTFIDTNQ